MANSTQEALDLAKRAIDEIQVKAEKLHNTLLSSAGELHKMLSKDVDSFKELGKTTEEVNVSLGRLKQTTKELSQEEAKLKIEKQALNQQTKLEENSTNKLVGAYANLVAKQKLAKKALQDLIVSQGKNNAETKKAQQEYNRLTARVNQANKATSNFANTGLGGMARGFKNLLSAFGLIGGIQLFAQFAKQGFDLARKLDSLNFTMKAVIGNAEILQRTQLFLAETAEKYGASILTLTDRYNKFYTAARQSGVTLKDTEAIFKSFTKSAGFLGLSSHELEGVFLALEQMLSKGKVTTEELRRQLAERLPGAFGVMAQTVQKLNPDIEVTVSTLDKMLRAGTILSAEVLPEFSKQYEKSIGIDQKDSVETLNASIERMSNSWVKFIGNLTNSEGAISKTLMFTIGLVGGLVNGLNLLNETQEDFNSLLENKAFVNQAKYFDGLGKEASNYAKITKKNAEKRIKEITKEIEFNNNLLKLFKTDYPAYYKLSREHNKSTTQANQENKKLNNSLSTQNGILKAANIYSSKYNENKDDAINKERTMAVVLEEKKKLEDELLGSTKEQARAIRSKIAVLDLELKAWEKLKALENIDFLKGTIEFYKKQISLAEESINKTALSRREFFKFTKQIENAKDALADLEVKFNVLKPVGFDTKFFENLKKPFEDVQNGLADAPKLQPASKETLEMYAAANKLLREIKNRKNDFKEYKELFKGVTDTFGDIFDVDFSKFDFIFDSLGDKTDELFSADKIGAWADLSKELIGSVLDASLQSYDIELQAAQRTRDLILNNDLASSEAKEAARKQFDERERDINNRKAKQERKNALIKIAIDTAVGVAKVIAQTGVLSPFAIPLIVGLGLAQAALVVSQPLPQFKQGTENAPKGWAITQEKRPEPITDKFGNLKTMGTKGGNSLTYLEKGDKVFKNQEDYFNSLANDDLQRVVFEMNMSSNGRSLSENVTDKALLNKIDMLASSNEMVWREVKKLASRPINVNNKVEIKTNKAY